MTLILHDLAARDGRRPSPFCWRAKYALAHKGLTYEAPATCLTDIPRLYGGIHKTVPILADGEHSVSDSWAIAKYLDETYPDRPRLFSSPEEEALCRFLECWLFGPVAIALFPIYVKDIHDRLLDQDHAYFRETREKRLGRTLEEVCAGREERLSRARESFMPVRLMLSQGQPFLSGERAGYADYMLAGALLWLASIATLPLFEADDPLVGWFERARDLCGGVGRTATLSPLAA